jgi:protein O-mannosyl-transferase
LKKHPATLAVCVLLAAATLLAFWQVGRHQFVNFDDTCYVTDNPHVQAGLTWEGLHWAFAQLQGQHTYWHPLTWVSHMADCALFGLQPAGHHLVNLLFHLLNVVLVFLVFRRMTQRLWPCAVLAALFALHPLQVDTVAWVAERKNLLSACFWLLTMLAYVRYTQSPRATTYLPIVLLYACGLMCKPVLVTLPLVLLLLDYWPLRRLEVSAFKPTAAALGRLAWEKGPLFLLAALSCLITLAGHRTLGALGTAAGLPMHLRVENALVSYARYLGKTVFPAHLAMLYPYPAAWPLWGVTLSALLLIVGSALAVGAVRRWPYLFVGWFWFLGVLVPFIGVIQAGEQAMADRFMYLPIIGLLMIAVWGLDALAGSLPPQKRWWLAGAAALAIAACLILTPLQVRHWQDSESLFRHAIAVTSGNYVAYDGLGSALDARGRGNEALACYAECVRLKPRYAEGQYDYGSLLMRMGKLDDAVLHLTAAVAAKPSFAQAQINLGNALLQQDRPDEAARHLAQAVRLTPQDPEAHYNLGTVLIMQGQVDQAVACFSEALRLNPNYSEAHGNLGVALMRQGKPAQGALHLAAAAKLTPANPQAHDNLGLALLDLNRPAEAAAAFAESLRLNPDSPASHYHLALALIRQDKRPEALPYAQKARTLAQAAGQTALLAKVDELLQPPPPPRPQPGPSPLGPP